ncbi:hypothetical protein LTR86_010448 [Recurvomyces mirabilis]|nr:hypothetical protein LTR86_010448 [Recurvomyces mirabilis]
MVKRAESSDSRDGSDVKTKPRSASGTKPPADGKLVSAGKKRTRTGCLNCRRKRRKCDETKPTCEGCQARNETCEWGLKLSFRPENAQHMSDEHPSMRQAAGHTRGNSYQIVDVTSEVIRDYFEETNPMENGLPVQSAGRYAIEYNSLLDELFPTTSHTSHAEPKRERHASIASIETASMAMPKPPLPHLTSSVPLFSQTLSQSSGLTPLATPSILDSNIASLFPEPPSHSSGLTPLATPSLLDANGFSFLSPQYSDTTLEDGIFLPGSQYQELHSQLRTRIIDTARSTAPSRIASPEIDLPPTTNGDHSTQDDGYDSEWRRLAQLSPEQELILIQNYINEVAPWLDKFDLNRHMELRVPPLAKSHAHLKYSILALSARQIERKEQKPDYSWSLALYAHAIHLLSPVLHKRSTEVLASCVILAVLEMMSCSPRAWRRHLDGCAALIQALGISGACGGFEQALFWIFARMDVVGGLVSSEKTLIPMHNWMCGGDITIDMASFSAQNTADMYANQMEYLSGRMIELLCSSGKWEQKRCKRSNLLDMVDYTSEWSQLFEMVESWYRDRPEGMKALLSISSHEDPSRPFPTLYFGNGPAVSGNQMYHTTALLMLKHKPAHVTFSRKPNSMLWHARQICAISISNSHHGSWTNSTQPLWIAGQQMSHPSEHKAILEILERIERESGWASKWRADDLRDYWGHDVEV